MSGFPRSPKVLKGAIIGVDPFNPLASVVIFQYNPDQLTRTIQASAAGGQGSQGEALRLKGPPQETIKLDIEVDASDQLEKGDALATSIGVSGSLAALEMLLYPKTALVVANQVLAALGVIEIIPPQAPLALLVWNVQRILPVRVTEMSITEEAFDTNLNPIRAKVGLGLRVLTYDDLGLLSVGGALFLAHQIGKEVIATRASVSSIANAPAPPLIRPPGA
jgi:hypothetical protein